jgi:predicted ATPase
MEDSTVITRVVLRNYKSIAACDVGLGPLTFIVGPNGSGKSNFVDALRFIADAVRTSVESALRTRGGVAQVRRRGEKGVRSFRVTVELRPAPGLSAEYSLEVAPEKDGGFRIREERCVVTDFASGDVLDEFTVRDGVVKKMRLRALVDGAERHFLMDPAQVARVTLFLPTVAAISDSMRHVSATLAAMSFFNINSHHIKTPGLSSYTDQLMPDGGNLAGVFRKLQATDQALAHSILGYLRLIVPNINDVDVASIGGLDVLEFSQKLNDRRIERFYASAMSDGTLRALAILVGLFQTSPVVWMNPRLVAIEEPELALHPAAARILLDALRIASIDKQVIVTSHSDDLIDDDDIETDSILAVGLDHGVTLIGPVDEIARNALREELFTAGEMLRSGQLVPDPKLLEFHIEPTSVTGQ